MTILQIVKKNIWKLIKQNKLFDGINDVIFDDPYLTEQKDSANIGLINLPTILYNKIEAFRS